MAEGGNMLIDGEEVIYSMEDKKIVYPEIPTKGLVCYLDARGKYNTDVYRNTLLDLSGNGNHGALRNFNFTEELGYVEDLLGGGTSGLKFDGVDDQIRLYPKLTDFTIILDAMTPFMEGSDNYFFVSSTVALFIYSTPMSKNLLASILRPDGTRVSRPVNHESMGKICIKVSGENLEIKTNNQIINENVKNGSTYWRIGMGQVNFRKCMVWNRALTDEEITKLMEVE